jgi:PIN domain nuclease of toxin-antitoxin system
MNNYVLDACALIALLQDETADHHEFDAIADKEAVNFYWIR